VIILNKQYTIALIILELTEVKGEVYIKNIHLNITFWFTIVFLYRL